MSLSVLLNEKCAVTFLKAWLSLQQEKNPRFGTRAACKMLGIGHGTLSNILARRRKLSMGLAVRMAEKMNLDLQSKNHFLLLNTLNEMDSDRLHAEIEKRIRSNANFNTKVHFWDELFLSLGLDALSPSEKDELASRLQAEIRSFLQSKSMPLKSTRVSQAIQPDA